MKLRFLNKILLSYAAFVLGAPDIAATPQRGSSPENIIIESESGPLSKKRKIDNNYTITSSTYAFDDTHDDDVYALLDSYLPLDNPVSPLGKTENKYSYPLPPMTGKESAKDLYDLKQYISKIWKTRSPREFNDFLKWSQILDNAEYAIAIISQLMMSKSNKCSNEWKQAVSYLKTGMDSNNSHAKTFMGYFILIGKYGIHQNTEIGIKLLEEAASSKNPIAQHILGVCNILELKGLPQNFNQGLKLLQNLEDSEFAEGVIHLALSKIRGLDGLPKNYKGGMKLLNTMINVGNDLALHHAITHRLA